jgi:hypothetical protein
MEAIRLQQVIAKNGEIYFKNLPLVEGQEVEVIILLIPKPLSKKLFTARQLLNSGLIGLWEECSDITDSLSYARELREKAQMKRYDSFR